MRLYRILLLLAAALLPACNGNPALTIGPTGLGEGRMTLYVAPYTRTCTGMYEMECLLVRESPNGEWLNFYDPIEGFTYEPGYSYVLLVGSRHIPNPPADGSSREYWLVEVVEKVRTRGP